MLLFLAMIGHDRLTPQRQNHAISICTNDISHQWKTHNFFGVFWQEKRMREKNNPNLIRPIYIGKNQNPKNVGLHCQKNP